ncbi:TOL [Colletotrichum higginsianum]|uniref:TOL n=1 Tax=Colletotrichum higginsianum (strain IMI 349063) TaxID=759273 RepID=H1V3I5_COLHI|nr:TOL protein [Colletotrichum higginsianum IMI 349063]OBR09380.1 TOL protein [Colletotrichum higginsianum IMI 349063]CCF34787.1 TOL [Colletotrichum higginsianum]
MMICEDCQLNILKSEKTWDYHHATAAKLIAATGSGCVFCQKLAASAGVIHGKDDTEPLYRWTIRETAQTRETKSYISITFRPVVNTGHENNKSEELPEVRFDLFPEEDLGFITDEKSFGLGTDSEASQKQMKRWIDHCVESHPKCQPSLASNAFMPTRVLDIGAANDPWPPLQIRVIQTNTISDEARKYMTLSHCWGKEAFVTLTVERFDKFTNDGIPWSNSSSGNGISSNQNFIDAIKITQKLGIRYLWIDSICIIQEDEEDWAVEAKIMHKVYRYSYCNLAAVDSKNCLGGLFRGRKHGVLPATYDPRGSSHRLSGRKWRILTSDLWDKDLLGSPLYTRGWVFQERMLSPRLLQFGHSQLFWDCATISACEALPEGFPLSLDAKAASDRHWRQRLQEADITQRSPAKGSQGSLETLWESSVSAYTACDLTKHSDKDKAMWGIAKLMRDMLGQEYAHGLWSTCLEEQLAWRVAGRPKVVDPEKAQGNTAGEKGDTSNEISFPYWSWTHLDVPIQVVPRFRDRGRFYRATNHDGGKVGFQFKNPFSGWMKRENFPGGEEEFDRMTGKSINAEEEHGKAEAKIVSGKQTDPTGNAWKPDESSKLAYEEITIQGHVCKGTLKFVSVEERWEVAIEGVQGTAVIEAFPDVQTPSTQFLANSWCSWHQGLCWMKQDARLSTLTVPTLT